MLQLLGNSSVPHMPNALPNYEDTLAPYAAIPAESRGRLHVEEESPGRTCFQRDRDRIIHSSAFRRLEYKTQVFVNHEGDHYRTRLTHSLEVAQLTRSLCRTLHLNEDLGETLALSHDLGHTPFGHAGEDGLREVMAQFGGFSHNAQAIRILTLLESRYASFRGLNLTWETLEGIAKHNGPLDKAKLPMAIAEYDRQHDLQLETWAGAEAQIAALCDDIAYHNHDIEDGIRARLFTLDDLKELPWIAEIIAHVDGKFGTIDPQERSHEVIRRMINRMAQDLARETSNRIAKFKIQSSDDIRNLGQALAGFSEPVEKANQELKTYLMEHMYRHYRVNRMASKARRIVSDLFTFFHTEPECLPTRWRVQANGAGTAQTARLVADFVAGMTDRFALDEYKRVFDMEAKQ